MVTRSRGSHLEVALTSCGPVCNLILCRPLVDILHYLRRIQTTLFPKQPDFDLYNRWITSKLRDVSCDELQSLNGELITKATTMEKMGMGEPTNEDLVDQMRHILEDFESFRIELRAR